jgi:hypothetical protein
MDEPVATYPATLEFDPPEKVANWRPLVNWILAIPHFVILYFLRIASEAVALISWLVILFTGSLPEGFANFQAMYLRYELRTYSFSSYLRNDYPPFAFGMTTADDGLDPRLQVNVQPELANRNRLTVAFRIILVIPQLIVLLLLGIALLVIDFIAFFAVLFTGRWPSGLRDFVVKVARWYVRVQAYFLLLTDRYPPFTLD